ncbi:hypothetical protein K458DRAFT_208805 [Lentithecium fluviatile CBS 122367]|uniref:Distal membrane-arm assembly complex protein 1-like domain-containing protein n=1 Tax=Lentithecium fluviatile CBS 122367 TaxID=1168545 RepID=A0A6G1J7I4_9PLEO|nr:hypothetical protein K458DRAFT_208805 [Lentithecium fluviatile CBS 122367]
MQLSGELRASTSSAIPQDTSAWCPSPQPAMAIEDAAAAPTFKEALKQDKAQYDDCTPCRVIGTGAFVGLGAYTYVSGHAQLKAQEAVIRRSKSMFGMKSRRAAITGTAAGLVGLGVYRWFA